MLSSIKILLHRLFLSRHDDEDLMIRIRFARVCIFIGASLAFFSLQGAFDRYPPMEDMKQFSGTLTDASMGRALYIEVENESVSLIALTYFKGPFIDILENSIGKSAHVWFFESHDPFYFPHNKFVEISIDGTTLLNKFEEERVQDRELAKLQYFLAFLGLLLILRSIYFILKHINDR